MYCEVGVLAFDRVYLAGMKKQRYQKYPRDRVSVSRTTNSLL